MWGHGNIYPTRDGKESVFSTTIVGHVSVVKMGTTTGSHPTVRFCHNSMNSEKIA